jgi:hypothetical protein
VEDATGGHHHDELLLDVYDLRHAAIYAAVQRCLLIHD